MSLLTTENVQFILLIGGVIFTIYRSFRQPDVDADKHLALVDLRLSTLEVNVKTMETNHLPHIQAKIDDVHNDVSGLRNIVTEKFTRLEVLIEERMPKR